jgi:chromosome segregation protein
MLKSLEINGFKSFRSNSTLEFGAPISVIVGPNGSGKSNTAEAFRFVLGEQSLKALRARHSDELLYNGGYEGKRANRASVKAVFDNSSKQLNIEYSEVVIERIIQRGNASEYRINGSRVRLKDVDDLLSDANIGTSRHHIISQGEADRILNISERERKGVIEDALGLRRFYQQRREALQKLKKTENNLSQVSERLRDLKPELDFLSRQKKRIDETKELRTKLTKKYQQYFKREVLLLNYREEKLEEQLLSLQKSKTQFEQDINETKKAIDATEVTEENVENTEIPKIKNKIHEIENRLSETTRRLGEVSGQLQTLRRQNNKQAEKNQIRIDDDRLISHEETLSSLLQELNENKAEEQSITVYKKLHTAVRKFLDDITHIKSESVDTSDTEKEIHGLVEMQTNIEQRKQGLQQEKERLQHEREEVEKKQREETGLQHKAEKKLVELKGRLENICSKIERYQEQLSENKDKKADVDDEQSEARILCGQEALKTENAAYVDSSGSEVSEVELMENSSQRSNREFSRQLERLKIKLENTRVSDEKEVLSEFNRVKDQSEFLHGEISDLRTSKESLLELISDIEETVARKFDEGVQAINKAFSDFFSTMFGGGDAKLSITKHPKGKNVRVEDVDEDPEETERGIDISIKLPNKKVSGLGVLSGGERSLVSIALLFALSQINPPPFIVLDEADAALDESNSQRFGNMIERLSDRSQLVVVTHNRETMARADILYGVTMDQAGGSRLLSLNFTEAMNTVES